MRSVFLIQLLKIWNYNMLYNYKLVYSSSSRTNVRFVVDGLDGFRLLAAASLSLVGSFGFGFSRRYSSSSVNIPLYQSALKKKHTNYYFCNTKCIVCNTKYVLVLYLEE